MIKAIIIDDSPQAVKLLRAMITECDNEIEIIGEANDASDGLQLVNELKPDVVFLDIEMPGRSGIFLAEQLFTTNSNTKIVFTTAYNEYAIKAFRVSAIDYLLKPIKESELIDAIAKLKNILPNKISSEYYNNFKNNFAAKPETLTIPILNGFEFISLIEIEYIEADGSYTKIYFTNKKQKTVSKNLKYFEHALEHCSEFIRIHRSYIVNCTHVKSFSKSEKGTITMKSDTEIPITRERRDHFLKNMS